MNDYIGTKLDDLPVKYGLYNFGEVRELAVSSFSYVLNDIFNLRNDFIVLGFHLREIRDCEYYKDFGYLDFYEFCECNFNLKKSSVNNYILVHSTFCAVNGSVLTNRLDKRYSDYSYGQLVELCSVPEDERKDYPSSMTVKQIRNKKAEKKKSVVTLRTSDQTSGQNLTKKNYLSILDLCNLKGIVLQNKIKKADFLAQKRIVIYDENGKLLNTFFCDLLINGNTALHFRIRE